MTKLVIVDDHEALREGLAALLASHGLEIVGAAGNVAAGLDIVEHATPDIALVDIQLPDGSGIDLTRELIARRPELGVILYTGDSDAERLYSGLDSGARGYALKEGTPSELTAALTIRSSVISSPRSVATTWPRDMTSTSSQRPSSSLESDEAMTTGTPRSEASRRMP